MLRTRLEQANKQLICPLTLTNGRKDRFHQEVGMKDIQLKPEYSDSFFRGPIPKGGWPIPLQS